MEEEENRSCNFKITIFGNDLKITIDVDNQAQCPVCKSKFRQLLQHLKKSTNCNSIFENFESFQSKYKLFTNRIRRNNCRKRKLEANAEELHRVEAANERKQREKKISK